MKVDRNVIYNIIKNRIPMFPEIVTVVDIPLPTNSKNNLEGVIEVAYKMLLDLESNVVKKEKITKRSLEEEKQTLNRLFKVKLDWTYFIEDYDSVKIALNSIIDNAISDLFDGTDFLNIGAATFNNF